MYAWQARDWMTPLRMVWPKRNPNFLEFELHRMRKPNIKARNKVGRFCESRVETYKWGLKYPRNLDSRSKHKKL